METGAIVLPGQTADQLLPALERNMVEFYIGYGRSPGSEIGREPGYLRVFTGIPYPMFNGIFDARLDLDRLDRVIGEVQDYMAGKKAPCCWYITPGVRPASLGEYLVRHGFVFSGSSTGMWVGLDALDENQPTPPGLEIHPVEGKAEIETWVEVAWEAMGFPAPGLQRLIELETDLGTDPQAKRLRYLASLYGKPVATSLLLLHAGVAGIYVVSTLPDARRIGIGGAMTVVPLIRARQQGYQVGTLQASRMGFPVYRRLGFHEIFQQVEYEWRPV